MSDTSSKYELMVILSPDVLDKDSLLDEVRKNISDVGGEIFNEDIHGLRDFAFRIKKHDKGFYAILYVDFKENKDFSELLQFLNINKEILRYVFLKFDKHSEMKTLETYDEELEADESIHSRKKKRKVAPAKKTEAPKVAPKKDEPKVEKKEEVKEEPKEEPKVVAKEEPKEEPKEEVVEEKVETPEEPEPEVEEEPKEEKEEKESTSAEATVDREKKESLFDKKPIEKVTMNKESEEKLKEVDDKLKSIIDDPDITL